MLNKVPDPVDYLVIGHVTRDLHAAGAAPGGTAAYAGLTARALGRQVGIVTVVGEDIDLEPLIELPIAGAWTEQSTCFENIAAPAGRRQRLHHQAPPVSPLMVPETWRSARIVHLGPVAQEIHADFLRLFPNTFLGLTPQGWLRDFDPQGWVLPADWPEAGVVLGRVDAAVLSLEDLGGDRRRIADYAASCPTLVVTDGFRGARLFSDGEEFEIAASPAVEVDATGAGDIFAAAFFIYFERTRDALRAAQHAGRLAANSVEKHGLEGIPSPAEVEAELEEAL